MKNHPNFSDPKYRKVYSDPFLRVPLCHAMYVLFGMDNFDSINPADLGQTFSDLRKYPRGHNVPENDNFLCVCCNHFYELFNKLDHSVEPEISSISSISR